MERTVAGNFARTTQALADKAAPVVRKASGRAQSTVQQGLAQLTTSRVKRARLPSTPRIRS
jgi:hypothetical protein